MKYQKRRFWYRCFLTGMLLFSTALLFGKVFDEVKKSVPDQLSIRQGEKTKLSFSLPISASIYKDSVLASGIGNGSMDLPEVKKIDVDATYEMVMKAEKCDYYQMDLKLLGIVPLKTVELDVVKNKTVYPVGLPVGIYVKTNGVLVVDLSSFTNEDGIEVTPARQILRKGDYILKINDEAVTDKKDLIQKIRGSEGKPLVFTLFREGAKTQVKCKPERADDGEYKLGIWIRDSAQGIGTLTYLDQNGNFGALGHGINDIDTNELMQLEYGGIYKTDIIGIERGEKGQPGELTGVIDFDDKYQIGSVTKNTGKGIFGTMAGYGETIKKMTGMQIGLRQEVQTGDAQILCRIDESSRLYDVKVTRLHYDSEDDNRGIELEITDQELLRLTGGIVRGVSGAPIIQNGKMVGAVTHVLINDPARGYGIFAENMASDGIGS